ncbi:MAG: RHS repeat-associated core domain-containing protein, partial [Phycisphaerae bacterium]|nr:RHS repeat-associated core domain-containing protein [Phycisphaerae bacterium]
PGTGTSQGWNVVLVLDANNDTQRKYTWGLDLSGTVHAAGGIGGLLAVEETATQGSPAYWYSYDGNGNVGQVIAADGQSAVAKYEYGPYGNLIASSGTYVDANPFRLTTKWFDVETGMHYYGHRYYAPRLGRWLNRDPSNEAGGTNLYVFVGNRTLNGVDPTGLAYWDTSVDRSVCCKFRSDREVKLTPFNTQSGTIITTRWMENRTARSVSDTPMETCSCCEKGQLRRDVSIVSAAWGKCCTCRMVVFKDTGQGASHTFFAIKCPDDSLWTAVDRFPDGDGSFLQEWVATPAATGVKEMEDDKINSAPDIYRDSQIDCDTGKKIKADMWRIGNLPVGATGYWKWDCRFWAKGLHDYWRDEGYPPSEGRACN